MIMYCLWNVATDLDICPGGQVWLLYSIFEVVTALKAVGLKLKTKSTRPVASLWFGAAAFSTDAKQH